MAQPGAKPQEEDPAVVERREHLIKALSMSMFVNVTALCTPIQADIELFNNIVYPGQLAAAAAALTMTSSAAGGLEFLFNPTLGKLSDNIGRKPMFLVPSTMVALSNLVLALNQGNAQVALVFSALRKVMATWGGSVATMATIGDFCQGQQAGMAFARVFGAAGWGVIAGPLIGSQVLARTKSVRSVYAVAGLIAGALTLRNSMAIPETLAAEKRRPFEGFVNPFAFLKLFQFNPSMTKMVLAAVFPSFAEGKNLHDIQMLWMRNDVKLTTEALGTFITVWGIACTFSGMKLVPMLMKGLGSRAYTTLANAGNAANYALVSTLPKLSGVSQQALLYFALLFLLPGINGNNSSGCKGWAQSFSAKAGLAPGEYAGYFANARALTTMLAPFVYGRIYENCQKRNVRPTIIWVIATILGSLAPELLWRSIPASEMPDAPKPPVKEKPDSKSA